MTQLAIIASAIETLLLLACPYVLANLKFQTGNPLRSDNNETPCTSSTGGLPKVCLFCDHNIRRTGTGKREPLRDCQTLDSVNAIKNAAKILKDDRILSKIAGIDMIAKEAKYHHSCKRLFIRRADKLGVQSSTGLPENTRPHNEAFTTLQKHIEHTIISLSGAELLALLHSPYLNLLQIKDSSYSAKSLCDKILKAYPTSLSTTKENNKSGIVIHHNFKWRIRYPESKLWWTRC